MERPWIPDPAGGLGGTADISCVPCGTYQLVLHDTVDHPKTFALVNPELGVYHEPRDIPPMVIGRSTCLIHAFNWVWQSLGCTGVGMGCQQNNLTWMLTNSREALAEFLGAVPWVEGHTISIVEATT